MIGQIAVDIAAGGPEEKINVLDKISISSTKPINNSHISISSNELPKKISYNTNEINNNLIQARNNNANQNLHPQTTEPPVITEIENSQSEIGSSNDWITITKRSGIPDRVKTRYNEIQDFYVRNKKYPAPRVFQNKEGLIKDSNGNIVNGDLLEYDVPYPGQQGRDRKRIVIQKFTKNWWYTKDHYDSFIKMQTLP